MCDRTFIPKLNIRQVELRNMPHVHTVDIKLKLQIVAPRRIALGSSAKRADKRLQGSREVGDTIVALEVWYGNILYRRKAG